MDHLTLKHQAQAAIDDAQNLNELEEVRIQYLGKNGHLNAYMQQVKTIPVAKRVEFGQKANQLKDELTTTLEEKKQTLLHNPTPAQEDSQQAGYFDPTLPGKKPPQGHLHLVTQAIQETAEIFENMGFGRSRYPEVDWDYFAFEALNMPADHPARDEWETMFINASTDPKYGKMVLTPHTSNGQVREMLRVGSKPPIRMVNFAKCYRRQQDVTHTVMFHQFEGLVVDEHINITHLKGTLDHWAKTFYGSDRQTRLRPFHFQFTEPSFEIDINCAICLGTGTRKSGKKCRSCKQGWHELGGAGMVHPNVLKAGKIDTKKYTGFAFGLGFERAYMMRSDVKIADIRTLYNNDLRFLSQF